MKAGAYLSSRQPGASQNGGKPDDEPLKLSGFPDFPVPFSPVHNALKFSAVFGTTGERH